MKNAHRSVFTFLLVVPLLSITAQSTEPPDATSRASADAVIVGTVDDSRSIQQRKVNSDFYYVRLKVKVESVEKGHDAIRGASLLDLRCWREISASGAEGDQVIPADGTRFRAWLVRQKQGEFEPVRPDGIEILDDGAQRIYPLFARRSVNFWQIAGGAFGLLVLFFVAFLRIRAKEEAPRSWGANDEDSEKSPVDENRGE